jgi:hypothetical protein
VVVVRQAELAEAVVAPREHLVGLDLQEVGLPAGEGVVGLDAGPGRTLGKGATLGKGTSENDSKKKKN